MICELCNLNSDEISECQHPKNGYCALYLKQALIDGKRNTKPLSELKIGDTFRYIGSDEEDWHTVSNVDENKIYYPSNFKDIPQYNYKSDSIKVIIK